MASALELQEAQRKLKSSEAANCNLKRRVQEYGDQLATLREENTRLRQKSSMKLIRTQEHELQSLRHTKSRAERMMRAAELRLRQARMALDDIRRIAIASSAEASTLSTDLAALAALSTELGHQLDERRLRWERAEDQKEDVRRMEERGIHVQGKSPGAASADDDEEEKAGPGHRGPCAICDQGRALQHELVDCGLAACDRVVATTRAILDVAAGVGSDDEGGGGDG